MRLTNIYQAKTQLSRLIQDALDGKKVVIGKAGTPLVQLIPIEHHAEPRKLGSLRGKIKIADDFDELPDDILKAFGAEDSK